jgi:hypothetical protein
MPCENGYSAFVMSELAVEDGGVVSSGGEGASCFGEEGGGGDGRDGTDGTYGTYGTYENQKLPVAPHRSHRSHLSPNPSRHVPYASRFARIEGRPALRIEAWVFSTS